MFQFSAVKRIEVLPIFRSADITKNMPLITYAPIWYYPLFFRYYYNPINHITDTSKSLMCVPWGS